MKKMRNRIKLMAACAALSIACIGAGALQYSGASAVAENSDEFFVVGASVKYVHDVTAIEDQDGLRFAVVVKNDVFESWLNATQTGFAEGVSVGALALPKDLAMGEELTHSTEFKQVEGQDGILDREFAFEDFMDSIYEEYSNCKLAFVYLYDIPVDSYNREYMVSAYKMQDDETVYTDTVSRSIAWVADRAIADGDENADKLSGYIKQYAVNFYVNGEATDTAKQSIYYGGTIDTAKLPTVSASKVTWYVDEGFETPFDFTQKVTGTTNVYGKSVTRASLTDGVFSHVDNDYEVSGSGADLTLTQTLMNSSKKLGLAKFDVDGTADYSVSATITLSTPGTESWITDESNTRVGLAFYGEGEGANSYIYSYRAGNTVFIRNTNGANELYSDTTDDGRKSFWDVRRDYLSDGTTEFTMKVEKIGTAISVYVDGKLLETLTVAEGANLVPAIFSYTFENKDNVVTVTYSNIIVDACDSECSVCGLCTDGECLAPDHANKCVTALGLFGTHTAGYVATKDENGNWSVAQKLEKVTAEKGYAVLSNMPEDYYVSVDLKLTQRIKVTSQGWEASENDQYGFAFIDETAGENYRFLMRSVMATVAKFEKSSALFGGEGESYYLYGKTNGVGSEMTPFIRLQNTANINDNLTVNLAMNKDGNVITFYVNGEAVLSTVVEDGFTGVPALLAYSLEDEPNQTITYTNITVSEAIRGTRKVTYYINGEQSGEPIEVAYGETIDVAQLPTMGQGELTWYADETFETPFDFEQEITVDTNVYGKFVSILEQTGIFSSMEKMYSWTKEGEALTVTQNLQVSSNRGGMATMSLENNDSFYVSTSISLKNSINIAKDGNWRDGGNERIGFAFINEETGEGYRFMMRTMWASVTTYGKATNLYADENGTSVYLYGKTNSTPYTPYIKLNNTNNLNEVYSITLGLAKIDNALFFYVNGELVAYQEVEEDFTGVPALLGYSYYAQTVQALTFTNITVTEPTRPEYAVSFKVDGEVKDTATVAYGMAIAESDIPTTSAGTYEWFADEACETPFDFEQAITGATTVYGVFIPNEYTVTVYVNGAEKYAESVNHGGKFNAESLPNMGEGKHTWYADAEFTTEFDFEQAITGDTAIYGKYETIADLTGDLMESLDDNYAISGSGESLTLTQTLGSDKGLAYFNVGANDDYMLSVDIKLSNNPATAAQAANQGVDMRVGFALIDTATGENYRFLFRGTQAALIYYDKSTELYEYRSGSAFAETTVGAVTYVYGKDNSTPKEPKLVLQNTGAINNNANITLSMTKVGNTVSIYLNGEFWMTVETEEGFTGVPALFSYQLVEGNRTHVYSNINLNVCESECGECGYCADGECELHNEKCVATLESFGSHTSDYKAVKDANGNWSVSQALGNGADGKGVAYFNVGESNDYAISVDIKLSGTPATAAQGVNDGADIRVGFALINPETNENYRFLFRGTQAALIYYDKSTELYEVRSGSAFEETTVGTVTYVYGSTNSTPKSPMLVLQNTSAINGSMNIKLTLMKAGNTVAVLINGELWTTVEMADGFAGVPAFLSYSLDGKTRTHTYSNVTIKQMSYCDVCGLCEETECVIHNEKCIATLGYFGNHTAGYKAVKSNGNWTVSQTLGNGTDGKGLAYFNVGEAEDYSVSVDIKLSGNPATAAQGATVGADMRVGFALINPETGENYRFLFRGTQCALIYYDKSTELYEMRSGSSFEESQGAVTYVYGKTNSTPKSPMLVLQNTSAINSTTNITLKMEKVGNALTVYLNGELWDTFTVEEGFVGVPALLSYELDGKGGRTHTYSNVVITTGAENA